MFRYRYKVVGPWASGTEYPYRTRYFARRCEKRMRAHFFFVYVRRI